ncbi:MAG: hypothetical protein GXO47_08720 [Chlorobi bacterium]|nr:hypothetical protein [Chlorobiota bacterium]
MKAIVFILFFVLRVVVNIPDVRGQDDGSADTDSLAARYAGYEDNEKCFTCHGGTIYEFTNPESGKKMRRLMPKSRVLSKKAFYNSVHHNFSCTDCHSYEFNTFPHPSELIFEEYMNCIDCHGGDEQFAEYHFDEIQKEFEKSVHYSQEGNGFSCWKCHNPHTYVPIARRTEDITTVVKISNNMCLNCHTNEEELRLFSGAKELDVSSAHDWLPNQTLHFQSVRCIECHTQINDTVMVAHLVLPKAKAVQKCNECHSQNSILMATLYKFKAKEERRTSGFLNGIIINESYVIGANRNKKLNTLSIVIMLATLGGILIHLVLRLIFIKNTKHGT